MSTFRCLAAVSCLFAIVLSAGCSSQSTWIEPPSVDAATSAAKAIELYDTDGDGKLNEAELEKAPGLKAAAKMVDLDNDGLVSESEISERILNWQATKAGLMSFPCTVTLNGQPLEGATVTFEPESFLGDSMQTAVTLTSPDGMGSPSIPKENRPSPQTPSGLQLGFYRVQVSKIVNGKETIPAKYNTETILGQQATGDDPAVLGRRIRFDLKSP